MIVSSLGIGNSQVFFNYYVLGFGSVYGISFGGYGYVQLQYGMYYVAEFGGLGYRLLVWFGGEFVFEMFVELV